MKEVLVQRKSPASNSVKPVTVWLLLSQRGCRWICEPGKWHLPQTHYSEKILGGDCFGMKLAWVKTNRESFKLSPWAIFIPCCLVCPNFLKRKKNPTHRFHQFLLFHPPLSIVSLVCFLRTVCFLLWAMGSYCKYLSKGRGTQICVSKTLFWHHVERRKMTGAGKKAERPIRKLLLFSRQEVMASTEGSGMRKCEDEMDLFLWNPPRM